LLVCETREFFHRCLAERGPNRHIAKAELVAYREGLCPDKASHFPNTTINFSTLAGQPFRAPGTVRSHAVKEGQYDRITDAIAQYFEPSRCDLAIDIHRQ
jgi:hypothetical protein